MTNYEILKEYETHKTPMLSYDELQNMNKAVNECMAANIKLVEENKQLKELLRIILSKTKICYSMVFQKDIINAELDEALLKKINEVLK